MSKYRCIVAGSLGVGGRALLDELESRNEWDVFALSRRKPDFSSRANFISVDLGNLDDTKSAAKEMSGATHIFFAAYSPQPTLAEEVGPNLSMLKNLVTSVESTSPQLRHVAIVQGSKWYGNHLGPYKTPAKEDDPRHMPPNFYYDQQDWIEAYQKGKQWNWSSWRPHGFCGTSVGSAMNQLTGLAIYATISRELGLPLRFPGSPAAFKAVYQFTDASLLARALLWGSGKSCLCEPRLQPYERRIRTLGEHLARDRRMLRYAPRASSNHQPFAFHGRQRAAMGADLREA
ncbi:MAG: SDR family oxidoreductase [Rhizobiales bacterium]|nr:SDR family oxidoreductase [Hyphomicrobiales bacterium]